MPEAKALAGGMTLIPVLKQRLNKPSAGGRSGEARPGRHHGRRATRITIGGDDDARRGRQQRRGQGEDPGAGGMASHGSATTRCAIAARSAAAWRTTIRRLTIPAAALALGATIKTDRRSIKADDFFQGMFTTALEQGEIITRSSSRSRRRRPTRSSAIRPRAMPSSACSSRRGPAGVRVAVTGAGQGGVFRHTEMERR